MDVLIFLYHAIRRDFCKILQCQQFVVHIVSKVIWYRLAAQLSRHMPNSLVFSIYFEGHINGILPKGPHPPCLRMADRALLAGYHRYICHIQIMLDTPVQLPTERLTTKRCPGTVSALVREINIRLKEKLVLAPPQWYHTPLSSKWTIPKPMWPPT